jgi:hypothetical protein
MGWVPSRVHGEVLCYVCSCVTNAAEFCGSWAGPEGDSEEKISDGIYDRDASYRRGHVGVESAVGGIHVRLVYPDDLVWVASADVMDSVKKAPEGVTIHTVVKEIGDDPVVAAGSGGARKCAVVCSSAFDDAVSLAVYGPLDGDAKGSDACPFDVLDAVGVDGDGPFVSNLFIESFVEGLHIVWSLSRFMVTSFGEGFKVSQSVSFQEWGQRVGNSFFYNGLEGWPMLVVLE